MRGDRSGLGVKKSCLQSRRAQLSDAAGLVVCVKEHNSMPYEMALDIPDASASNESLHDPIPSTSIFCEMTLSRHVAYEITCSSHSFSAVRARVRSGSLVLLSDMSGEVGLTVCFEPTVPNDAREVSLMDSDVSSAMCQFC
jgi:hypothetical protein